MLADQGSADELDELFRKTLRKLKLGLLYIFLDFCFPICRERSSSEAQFVSQYSHAPNVDLFTVAVAFEHLGGDVVQGTAECGSFG